VQGCLRDAGLGGDHARPSDAGASFLVGPGPLGENARGGQGVELLAQVCPVVEMRA